MIINFFHQKVRKKSAFSLVEVSIILAILAVIIASSISISNNSSKQAKILVTEERLRIIETALESFIHTYKRLPCPTSLANIPTNAAYGVEAINAAGTACTDTGATLGTSSGAATVANTLRFGGVPVRTLGLSIELMSDGFRNKFSYVIPAATTTPAAFFKTVAAAPTNGFQGSNFGTDTTTTNNVINIRRTSSTVIKGNTVYLVMSHGPNGYGAVNTNATIQNSTSGASTDETSNYFTSTYDNIFIADSYNAGFDDILMYNDRASIITKTGALGNP